MEGSDHDVGRGVGGAAKIVSVKRAGYKGGYEARCVGVGRKKIRRILTKVRGGGTAELQAEVERWRDLRREERKCTECDSAWRGGGCEVLSDEM